MDSYTLAAANPRGHSPARRSDRHARGYTQSASPTTSPAGRPSPTPAPQVRTRRVHRVIVNLQVERCQDAQIRIVSREVDVEPAHAIRRVVPPRVEPVRGVVEVVDDRRLAVLRARRAVEVGEFNHACVLLVPQLRGVGVVQVEVGGDAVRMTKLVCRGDRRERMG